MNQVAHIFRKDCRHLWSYIVAVLVLTFLNGYGLVFIRGGTLSGPPAYVLLLVLAALSSTLLPIALFLLVVSVIQEESLVGSDRFWLTRPYSRRSLSLEKLLFLAVWAVLPMLLHDVVLVRYFGFSLTSAFGLLAWKSAQFALFLLIAAALAVLSASLGRAVVFGFATALIVVLAFFVVLQVPAIMSDGTNYLLLTILAIAALGAIAVVGFQYRFRITPVAAVIGVMAILVCALLIRFWPQKFVARWANRNATSILQSVQVRPDADLTGLPRPQQVQDATAQSHTVYYPFQAEGLADNVGFYLGLTAHLESPGQKPAPALNGTQVRFQPPPTGSPRFADAGGTEQLVPFDLYFAGDFDRVKNTEGTMSGTLYLQPYRSSVVRLPVPLPYQPQKFVVAGQRCSVEAGQREGNLVLRFECVELEGGNTSQMQVHLLFDNQEILPQASQGGSSRQGGWPSFFTPVAITNFSYEFAPRASADFFSDRSPRAEMLIFDEEQMAPQERPFRIDHFRPADLTLEAWQDRGVLRKPEHHLDPFGLPPRAPEESDTAVQK